MSIKRFVKTPLGQVLFYIPKKIVIWGLNTKAARFIKYKPYMEDEEYIRKKYKQLFGKEINLQNPRSFNEKSNWRKLYDRKDIYTLMVDKYRLKEIVTDKVGKQYTFPLLGVWDTPDEIDYDSLPNQFVLKANHAGGVIVCRNKESFNRKTAERELKKVQQINYYYTSREWPYKNVDRKIIAESYMGENLVDYKNYCFNGKVEYTFVWENESRKDGRKPTAYFCGAYDRKWERSEIEIDYPSKDVIVNKPACYDTMIEIAEKMSKGIPFVRVDCYVIDDNVYIGEMTFFPWGGWQKFKDEYWDEYLGDLEELPMDH